MIDYIDWAKTPPMGWNSWDSYGTGVTEDNVKANTDFMAEKLLKFGWQYVVVDIQWYQPYASGHQYDPDAKPVMDGYGRLLPAPNRFPSGFKALSDYVHSRGLKFGIHIMRGIPRQAVNDNLPIKGTSLFAGDIAEVDNSCSWNPDMYGIDVTKPGSQEYYDSIVEQYSEWGVDFIKADDMGSHLYQPGEIKALYRAIIKSGKQIVLSISPGPASVQEAVFFRKHAKMWRISDDFWDEWRLLKQQFAYTKDWMKEIGRDNTWPDADMLAIGRLRMAANGGIGEDSKLTRAEQRTMFTLWSIMRSPLMMGGDLPSSDEFAISLLTNPEVIKINQDSSKNRLQIEKDGCCCWLAAGGRNEIYLAAFNLSDIRKVIDITWNDLGLEGNDENDGNEYHVRDLWKKSDMGTSTGLNLGLDGHSCELYRLKKS
jgi:alpha-galactosidase